MAQQAAMGNKLPYPMKFFVKETGEVPKEDAEITLLWKWRRGRPAPTASETAVPDIQAMRKEMNNMKSSLKNYTSKVFFKMQCRRPTNWGRNGVMGNQWRLRRVSSNGCKISQRPTV